MKYQTNGISFYQRLPSSDEIEERSDGLIVIDDLMNYAVKDSTMLSTFTEGSHHKNISVVFIMQNIFHKGSHTRTMSINTQYKHGVVQESLRCTTNTNASKTSIWRKFGKVYVILSTRNE